MGPLGTLHRSAQRPPRAARLPPPEPGRFAPSAPPRDRPPRSPRFLRVELEGPSRDLPLKSRAQGQASEAPAASAVSQSLDQHWPSAGTAMPWEEAGFSSSASAAPPPPPRRRHPAAAGGSAASASSPQLPAAAAGAARSARTAGSRGTPRAPRRPPYAPAAPALPPNPPPPPTRAPRRPSRATPRRQTATTSQALCYFFFSEGGHRARRGTTGVNPAPRRHGGPRDLASRAGGARPGCRGGHAGCESAASVARNEVGLL